MPKYQVIVGNIGTVYDGDILGLAVENCRYYERESQGDDSRASGESVVLMADGEIIHEYQPPENHDEG